MLYNHLREWWPCPSLVREQPAELHTATLINSGNRVMTGGKALVSESLRITLELGSVQPREFSILFSQLFHG